MTLMMVAAMERRIMNRENDFCWLKAIRRAMKVEMFTIKTNLAVFINHWPLLFVCYTGSQPNAC